MNKQVNYFLSLFLFTPFSLMSQSQTLLKKVIEADTKQPIPRCDNHD